jgi:phosphatidylglycerol:prolipoprotein diacylglycerol transferase
MPTLYTTIGPWTFPTFSLFLSIAALIGAGIALRRAARPGAAADAYLGALVGAVVCARISHVILSWNYFRDFPHEAFTISLGGLGWHGAVLGGIAGLWATIRLRNWLLSHFGFAPADPYQFANLLDALTPALPLLGLAGWWGCMAALCGYGLEVDNLSNYPFYAVSESADVYGIVAPRYHTQVFGLLLSAAVLLFAMLLFWRGWLRYRRFWFTLALLSAGMFVIGFYRADAVLMIGNLRGDQIFDVGMVALAVYKLIRPGLPNIESIEEPIDYGDVYAVEPDFYLSD